MVIGIRIDSFQTLLAFSACLKEQKQSNFAKTTTTKGHNHSWRIDVRRLLLVEREKENERERERERERQMRGKKKQGDPRTRVIR